MEKIIMSKHPNVIWFKLNGTDSRTGVVFENEGFGVCRTGSIVNFQNEVLKESELKTMAVRTYIE